MALDAAWFNPVILNPDSLPALLQPVPMDHPVRIDAVTDEGPFATHEEYLPCPPAIPRNLTNEDIQGSQPKWSIKEPMDPMTLHKPYPDIWLVAAVKKGVKPSRTLQTERHTNPLDPKYKLARGECLLPAGNADFFSNRVTNQMDCSDVPGAKAESFYKRPIRECYLAECEIDAKSRPAKQTHVRERCNVGGSLDLFDISLGKKTYGFIRHPQSNPVEPLYPTEPAETPLTKYKRLKKRLLPPHKIKYNVAERILDQMYWKAEQLPDMCIRYGNPIGKSGEVNYEGLRKSLEQFGVNFNDKEYARLLRFADKQGRGVVKYRDFANSLKHCDGLELDVANELGLGLGVNWGHAKYLAQKPTCMGQGCAVIVEEKPRGPKKIVWSDAEQLYNPITGLMLPYQRPAQMSTGNSFQYNLNEVQAAMFMKNKEKNYYIPGPYLPRGSIPVTHSCAISKACTLPHVHMEGSSPAHDHYSPQPVVGAPQNLTPESVPQSHGGHQKVSFQTYLFPSHLEVDRIRRITRVLSHEGLAYPVGVVDWRRSHLLKIDILQVPAVQRPASVVMGGRLSLLDTAKQVGSVVRKASIEGQKLSEGFIKLPSLTS